ncbi:MAG: hypothetical protein ACOY3V_08070 [Pseudomonadota bacterium]
MLKGILRITAILALLTFSIQAVAGCQNNTQSPNFNEPHSGTVLVTAGTTFVADPPSGISYDPPGQTAHFFSLERNPPNWVSIDDQTGIMTISPPLGTSLGNYSFRIRLELACDSGKKQRRNFTVTVVAAAIANCSISAPGSISLGANLTGTYSYRVNLNATNNPTGISASVGTPAPSKGAATIDSALQFSYTAGSSTGGDTIRLTATCPNGGTASAAVPVTITAAPAPNCSISASPSSLTLNAGNVVNGSYTITGGGAAATIGTAASKGVASITGPGQFSYGTNVNTSASTDSFSLATVCPNGQTASVIVPVTINSATPNCTFSAESPLQVAIGSVMTATYNAKSTVDGSALRATVSSLPSVGSASVITNNQFTYQYGSSATLGATDSFILSVTCPNGLILTNPISVSQPGIAPISSETPTQSTVTGVGGASGTVYAAGSIIVDNTPNPGTAGISTNMRLLGVNTTGTNCTKTKQYGVCNSFSNSAIQVLQRVPYSPTLIDQVGLSETTCNGMCDTASHCVGDRLDPVSGAPVRDINNNTEPASGVCSSVSTQNQADATRRTTFFANGQHLFDLDRLRAAADYLYDYRTGVSQAGIAFTVSHPAGTFGTISWAQFLNNIANNRTMYGMVRVLIPLQLGTAATYKSPGGGTASSIGETCASGSPGTFMNAQFNTVQQDAVGNIIRDTSGNALLNQKCVTAGSLFGFCDHTAANSMCGTTTLNGGPTNSTATMSGGSIRVKGSLLYDFVSDNNYTITGSTNNRSYLKGDPISLEHLHFDAKAYTYIKVELPIMVNWANDDCTNTAKAIRTSYNCGQGPDGALDNIDYINWLTGGTSANLGIYGVFDPPTTIDFLHVPQASKDAYQHQFGVPLTTGVWGTQNQANRYHLLMASGYAQGWADAFRELGITSAKWTSIPITPTFLAPAASASDGILTVNEIRGEAFEDIPAYLYSGGLVDMHQHLNLSGLMYVPQSLELEAKAANVRQYVMGAIIMRDGFFIESQAGSVTVISSDPTSFSNIRVNQNAAVNTFRPSATSSSGAATIGWVGLGGGGLGTTGSSGGGGGGTPIFGGGSGGSSSPIVPGQNQWIQIHPRP